MILGQARGMAITIFLIPAPNSLHKWNLLTSQAGFVKMEQQILVGPVRPIRVDLLQGWSQIFWLDWTKTNLSIWVLTGITGIFGIIKGTPILLFRRFHLLYVGGWGKEMKMVTAIPLGWSSLIKKKCCFIYFLVSPTELWPVGQAKWKAPLRPQPSVFPALQSPESCM